MAIRYGNGRQLAAELNISPQAVSKAERSGRITRCANGQYDLDAAALQYRRNTDSLQAERSRGQRRRPTVDPRVEYVNELAKAADEARGADDYREVLGVLRHRMRLLPPALLDDVLASEATWGDLVGGDDALHRLSQ